MNATVTPTPNVTGAARALSAPVTAGATLSQCRPDADQGGSNPPRKNAVNQTAHPTISGEKLRRSRQRGRVRSNVGMLNATTPCCAGACSTRQVGATRPAAMPMGPPNGAAAGGLSRCLVA